MKTILKLCAFLFCIIFTGSSVLSQNTGDDYEKEIAKRIASGQITMGEIEAKIRSGEIKRLGGNFMNPKATVLSNVSRSKQHVTISEAIVSIETLKEMLDDEEKAYTLFAPYDTSFGDLPEGYLAEITSEGNEDKLEILVGNHIVKGNYTMEKLIAAIDEGKGRAELKTISGMRLYAFKRGSKYVLTDENGNRSFIRVPDIQVLNGTIHGVDAVLLKKKPVVSKEK